jgi:hypothetical protein
LNSGAELVWILLLPVRPSVTMEAIGTEHTSMTSTKNCWLCFFMSEANQCARNYAVSELGIERVNNSDKEESYDGEDDDDDEEFVYDASDYGEYDGHHFDNIWVECRPIEDARIISTPEYTRIVGNR